MNSEAYIVVEIRGLRIDQPMHIESSVGDYYILSPSFMTRYLLCKEKKKGSCYLSKN